MCVNDARLTSSRKTDSANIGGLDGVASSVIPICSDLIKIKKG